MIRNKLNYEDVAFVEHRKRRLLISADQEAIDVIILRPSDNSAALITQEQSTVAQKPPRYVGRSYIEYYNSGGTRATYSGSSEAKQFLHLYAMAVSILLVLWVFYLFIPRGIKRNAIPRSTLLIRSIIRRIRERYYYDYSESTGTSADDSPTSSSPLNLSLPEHQEQKLKIHSALEQAHQEHTSRKRAIRHHYKYKHPSPTHSVPPNPIIEETAHRLNQRGLRLTAHGIRSPAQRIWLRKMGNALLWQTVSVKRQSDEQKTFAWAVSPQHTLPIANIQYVDVGKHTAALKQAEGIPETHCCSILTAAGSLDLQAHSKTERDALVCVLLEIVSTITENNPLLDELHAERSSINNGPTFFA